ncbi:isochorismatase hydrolase [Colletotrichum tofieldiae]|uniref:Isochorismatase hydrolase n=1 Tax=Colletotrichum tofieldiae TaxID=708197 RepID=A0A161WBX3_9PEZI|nr:isochorismatase hydrolase [Colletotrichum tofieldiae]GKT64485.1 isochorismatase hydrolase [Colletotrichum tofieldiae]GKT74454.1 isochorismatase hydrolase [Colletotrichum tofieldiae]GKT91632.1 isochorismatase hydrolase [Colletotrichum tofieldiae]
MRPDVTFGPPGDEWRYERPSRTYDLTRGRSPAWTVGTSQGPVETSISVAPRSTALVVIDMQNYFLHPRCRDHPAGLAAVEKTESVIEKCRELGVQVIWLNWGLTDDDLAAMPASVQRGFSRSLIHGEPDDKVVRLGLGADLGDGQGRCLVAGEWNADIYEPLKRSARPEDVRCDKNRMSGLWSPEQPLRRYLERPGPGADAGGGEGKRTLLFAGVNTDQCVLSTLTDAYNAGWDCVLLDDCCATKTPGAREVCLYNVAGSYGFVISSEAFLAGKVS